MINLVRNELIKIFSKKGIYVYTIVVLVMMVFVSVLSKNLNENSESVDDFYIETIESNLGSYDLSNESELRWYIGDRVIIDSSKISKQYKYESPEYYYVEEFLNPMILEKYEKEYIDKDLEGAKLLQAEIDKRVSELKNFDWKKQILDEKDLLEVEINNYKTLLLNDNDDEEIKKAIEELNLQLWCLNYRLQNNIPYSYASNSSSVESYKSFAIRYMSLKDEKLITDKKELAQSREIKANYEISKYKLEHKLEENSQDMLEYVIANFAYVDGLIIMAIVLICGSIVSEEFNKGTIKQLLTKPFSRNKIFTSKVIAGLIACLAFVLLYELVFVLANCYEYGDFTSIFGSSVIYDYDLGKVREVSVLGQCLYSFIMVLPSYLIIFAIVMCVGAISTSSVTTMIAGIGVFFVSGLLDLWFKPEVLSYIPFYTWDLTPFMYGGMSSNIYSSLGKSLFIDIITITVFIVVGYIFFNKKDIKNQ